LAKNDRDRVIKNWESRALPELLKWIEAEGRAPISPQVVSAISAIRLQESSKTIEKLTWALVLLTIILTLLTLVLAWHYIPWPMIAG
jgi:hypothetical protein